jgi:hypothetical protein
MATPPKEITQFPHGANNAECRSAARRLIQTLRGAAAPSRSGATAAVAMDRGITAGSRTAVAQLVVVCCVLSFGLWLMVRYPEQSILPVVISLADLITNPNIEGR